MPQTFLGGGRVTGAFPCTNHLQFDLICKFIRGLVGMLVRVSVSNVEVLLFKAQECTYFPSPFVHSGFI